MSAAPWPASVLIVGCGNMGGAMLSGWLAGGLEAGRFVVVDPVLESTPAGVELLRAVPDRTFDAVLLGIKPQGLGDVAPQVAKATGTDGVVLSILAGVELDTLAGLFGAAAGLVRIMPNLSAAIGKSPIALAQRGLDDARQQELLRLMAPLGTPEWIGEELFDLVTALAGSGPAFVYRYIDALARGAAALGLDPAQADRLALATVEGAALLAASSPHDPGELARRVASPGGTTRAGLDVLDAGDALQQLVKATLAAASARSAAMARQSRG